MAKNTTKVHPLAEIHTAETEILAMAKKIIAHEEYLMEHQIALSAHGKIAWAYGILSSWHESQRLGDPCLR